ncbi:Glycosyltransferase involved in cell wall bisynthesis [Flavobacterium sp. 9AF]|uniref:glycosyltransferase n=1 Tax=Flavobacterium sp. 9AF TaxID=2653142 RepID=UPI0012F28193|nr:glycosyltransferase [Flavobacterium sp. 9AF]VXC31513.1 Glycosyltransferase involved in cell wall bisynthesis [Flavobacterium sp. 9AF]
MKTKILYTIPNFDTAGSGKVLYDLAKGLNKDKFEVIIACSNNKGAFFKEVENLGLPIFIKPITKPLRPYYSFLFRLKEDISFIKKHKIDIVHSWHWSSDWSEVLAARLGGAKFIYTKKAMTWGNIHWKIKSYLSNFIITINDEMKNYFPNKSSQKLIPLGLDTNYYDPNLFVQKKDNSTFKIITVANLVPVKGIEVLINAVKLINNKNIYLEVVGDDRSTYASDLKKKVIALGLENHISFLGKHNDVRPFLAQADLYVIPTLNEGRKEGMPMALVEAMSMGKSVLGSDISGINYVLKDFKNLLFEAKNEKQLAEKIKECFQMTMEERVNLGNRLRQYCLDNFSYDEFINNHEALYTNLLN